MQLFDHLPRTRVFYGVAAALIVLIGTLLPSTIASGRVDPSTGGQVPSALNPDVLGTVNGGGTVTVISTPINVVASFGINARRPAGFVSGSGGVAEGRISYDKHGNTDRRHVNVPVAFMQVELSVTPTQNGTGGRAQLQGDCNAPATECPTGFQSVLVYVEDNSDTGQADVFEIQYCLGAKTPFPSTPTGCSTPFEGGQIRTGNIQIRPQGASGSAQVPTAARAPLRLP
jgi:hypothetical protein